MSVYTKVHYKALTDLVELMAIISTLAIGIDLYWCISDFFDQNFTFRLVPIILGLALAFVGMCYAVFKYHVKLFNQICHDLKLEKVIRKHKTGE